ncbi:MAG: hypothetical protein RLZZ207_1674 [Bacteroidota bacterium]|jgi:hypothetical protein
MSLAVTKTKQIGIVLLSLLFLGLLAMPLLAQEQPKKFLLLKRGSTQKSQIRFYPGEDITYKSKKIGYFVTDRIVNLDTEYLYLSENILNPSDIVAIDIRAKDPRNRTLNNLTNLSLGAGTMAIALEGINNLYQQGKIQFSPGVIRTSAILLGTGFGLLPLRYKTFTLSDKNKLQLVLLEIE